MLRTSAIRHKADQSKSNTHIAQDVVRAIRVYPVRRKADQGKGNTHIVQDVVRAVYEYCPAARAPCIINAVRAINVLSRWLIDEMMVLSSGAVKFRHMHCINILDNNSYS